MSYGGPSDFGSVLEAHGILGSLAWVVFLPLGAILIKVVDSRYSWLIHTAVQAFGLVLFTVSFGGGVWMVLQGMFSLASYHPTIGIVVFAFAWTQPFSGLMHHLLFKKKGGRTILSHLHIWLGRILITLGIIEGGLGLLYGGGDSTTRENIAYGIIAAVIWLVYIGIVVFEGGIRKKPAPEALGKSEN